MTHKKKHVSSNNDLATLKKIVEENSKKVLSLTVVVAVIVFGYIYITQSSKKKNAEASELLSVANNIQDLETLVKKYSSSDVAPMADFALAKGYYDAGRFDEAISVYKAFPTKFPKSNLKLATTIGILFCQEAKGNYDAALKGFDKFISENPESYLVEQAIFAKAKCLQELGQVEEAKVVYKTFINSNPNSEWSDNAKMLLEQL